MKFLMISDSDSTSAQVFEIPGMGCHTRTPGRRCHPVPAGGRKSDQVYEMLEGQISLDIEPLIYVASQDLRVVCQAIAGTRTMRCFPALGLIGFDAERMDPDDYPAHLPIITRLSQKGKVKSHGRAG